MIKNKKGITLISLVITIILLLILAAVAISLAVDSDGLFRKAGEAANKWNTSVAEEEQIMAELMDELTTTVDEILVCEGGVITGVKAEYLTEPSEGECVENKLIATEFENLVIPNEIEGQTVTAIGEMAFAGIRNLKTVELPETVTTIGAFAFTECVSLKNVNGLENVNVIRRFSFYVVCGVGRNISCRNYLDFGGASLQELYRVDVCLLFTEIRSLASVVMDNGDAWEVFKSCTSLCFVDFGGTSGFITEQMFYDCSSLEVVSGMNSISGIGYLAFGGCTSLSEIIIPESVTAVENYAFERLDEQPNYKLRSNRRICHS